MTLLVTGGGGFVMSNLVRHWLESDAAARVVVLDARPLDTVAERFFAPVRERLEVVVGDVADPATWAGLGGREEIAHMVHGAAVTPTVYTDAEGRRRDPEAEAPRRVIEVNVMGTVGALDFARRLSGLRRFVYVSSGAVYVDAGPTPLPEDGYVDPKGLYAASKHASELIVRRYAAMYGLDATAVRPSSVYGPMDRWTGARNYDCIPNVVAHRAAAGRAVRVNAADAVGDFIHAGDVATAIAALLRAGRLDHAVYNVAYGATATIAELAEMAGAACEEVAEADADVVADPRLRTARHGAYDISRLEADAGWRPRPLAEAMRHYVDWIREYETAS